MADGVFEHDVINGWWPGEYVLGYVPWHRDSSQSAGSGSQHWSNWTSSDFDTHYRQVANRPAGYTAAATFSAAGALVAAIEASGSLETEVVAAAMRNRHHHGSCTFARSRFGGEQGGVKREGSRGVRQG